MCCVVFAALELSLAQQAGLLSSVVRELLTAVASLVVERGL